MFVTEKSTQLTIFSYSANEDDPEDLPAGQAGVLQEDLEEISYKALPADLMDKVQVDVGEMKIGDVIKVKDLEIAKNPNIDLKTDPEAVVVSCTAVHNSVPEPETAEEAE